MGPRGRCRQPRQAGRTRAGVRETRLKKARATLLSVASRRTSSRVSRTHVASLKSSLCRPSSHTRNHVPSPGCFPSLHRSTVPSPTFVLFTSASVLFSSRSLRSRRRPPPNLLYTYIWSFAARFPNRSRETTIRK